MPRPGFFWCVASLLLFSCCESKNTNLSQIKADRLAISDSLQPVDSIVKYVTPFRNRVNEVLDKPLSYNPEVLSERDGVWNTSAGNLMANSVLNMADPVFFERTGNHIDFVMLNHGGVRSGLPAGDITARHAYELMPFENIISVITLNGEEVRQLISFLVQAGRPHPFAGMQIILNKDGGINAVNIRGQPFNEDRDYYVATSSYLVDGSGDMGFFPTFKNRTDLDYLLRNAIIDYFKKTDTIRVSVDDRFYQLQ